MQNGSAVGRNARRRAEKKAEHEHHGVAGEQPEPEPEQLRRCPRCGSTDLVTSRYMAGVTTGVDIICGHCNWHGMLEPGIW
jgi:hypothetical protein